MILITSAAYVVPGIRNELGMLPPTLLPIGNKRLLEILEQLFDITSQTADQITGDV